MEKREKGVSSYFSNPSFSLFRERKKEKSIDFCDGDDFFPLSFQKSHIGKRKKRKGRGEKEKKLFLH